MLPSCPVSMPSERMVSSSWPAMALRRRAMPNRRAFMAPLVLDSADSRYPFALSRAWAYNSSSSLMASWESVPASSASLKPARVRTVTLSDGFIDTSCICG